MILHTVSGWYIITIAGLFINCSLTMSTKHCPCGKKKPGLYIHCFNKDCQVGWWHIVCCGFNKDITKKQIDSLGYWTCPCCVMRNIKAPASADHCAPCNTLVSKMDEQLNALKEEIADLKILKQGFADLNKEQANQKHSWPDILGNIPKGSTSRASLLGKSDDNFFDNICELVCNKTVSAEKR